MLGGCYHASLLWALETLSISKDYHGDAIETLCQLIEHDPGGKWLNRPAKSLQEIYCPWHLQSDVSMEERITYLDKLLRKYENTVWDILFTIAFDPPMFARNIPFPQWRNWGLEIRNDDNQEAWFILQGAAAILVLERLNDDFERWKKLIEHIKSILEPDILKKIFDLLTNLQNDVPDNWSDSQKASLVDVIRDRINWDERRKKDQKIYSDISSCRFRRNGRENLIGDNRKNR